MSAAPHSRPSTGPRRLHPFVWVMLASALLFVPLFAFVSFRALRDSETVRDDGWRPGQANGAWVVAAVDAQGPVAALLQPGDRILAFNGDARTARVGPVWQLAEIMPGESYRLTVQRGGAPVDVTVAAGQRANPGFARWVIAYLAVSLTCFIVAMMVAFVKPEDRMVQLAIGGQFFLAPFMMWVALQPVVGIRQDRLLLFLGLAFPLYFICGYLFFERFPQPAPRTRFWTWVTRGLVTSGLLVWAIRSSVAAIRALPTDTRMAILDRYQDTVLQVYAVSRLTDQLFIVATFVAMYGVLYRNYKILPVGGSDRRRVKILVIGQSLPLFPTVVAAAISALGELAGASALLLAYGETIRRLTNALAIAGPLSFGYAIVRHRVLGFRLTVRLGIQYVLAQNALRTAVAVPLAWLAYTVITRPDQTVGELLFTGSARLNLVVMVLAGIGLQYRTQLAEAIDRRFFRAAYDAEGILRRLVEAVKLADSAAEIAETASREIGTALHVERVLAFYRNAAAGEFTIGYSSHVVTNKSQMSDESPMIRHIGELGGAQTVDELRASATPREIAWLEDLGIELVIPMTGIDQDVVGLLMVGGKRSEEPFTSQDRGLLQLVAAQIGSVYEVLSLREQVGRQADLQSEVLASIDERHINLVKECPQCGRCYDRTAERCTDDGQPLAFTMPVERTLGGKYRLDRLVGRGGMGAVYEALDLRLNRIVALKVIKGSSFHNTSARRRFAREAQACARLTHPAIVRVYDYGAFENSASYLVMEYVRGRTWRQELDRLAAFTPAAAADLLDQVMDGMEAAHASGVLHRDLKPDNLVIAAADHGHAVQVKILDFGLAKVRESGFDDPKSQTMAGVAMGTFGYMSPEQLAAGDVDARTDVYSIGVVALESLTGRLPAFGPNFHPLIEAEVERRLVQAAQSDEHRELARAVAMALATNRDARYASVRELRAALIPAIRRCREVPLVEHSGSPTGGTATPSTVGPTIGLSATETSVTRAADVPGGDRA
jgi:hypothetical protein